MTTAGAGALAGANFFHLIGQLIFGGGTKLKDLRSPQQKQMDEARLGASLEAQKQLQNELAGMNREDFKKRRRAEFELNKIPELEQRFSKYGNTRSGDFNTALARAERENEVALDKNYYETLKDLVGGTSGNPLSQGFETVPTKGQLFAQGSGDVYKSVADWIQRLVTGTPSNSSGNSGGTGGADNSVSNATS